MRRSRPVAVGIGVAVLLALKMVHFAMLYYNITDVYERAAGDDLKRAAGSMANAVDDAIPSASGR